MEKPKKIRLDALILERNMAESLAKAQALCLAGQVIVDGQRVDRGSVLVPSTADVRIKSNRYVSRGGEKLAGAVADLGLEDVFAGKIVLDVGASTGGFTDFALQHGAEKVIALDVGTSQLAWSLRQDPRVISLEQTHIRDFQRTDYPAADVVVADISFNSLARLAGPLAAATAPDRTADYLLLVKPQFELNSSDIPSGGVVIDPTARVRAVEQVVAAFFEQGLTYCQQAPSRVTGRDGNQEVFVLLRRPTS